MRIRWLQWLNVQTGPADDAVMAWRADQTAHAGLGRSRIVWACPDPTQRDAITHVLAESVEVITVADGAAALQAVHEHLADLVLSAVAMPHVGGFELLTALRTDPAVRLVPVIFVVEHADTARPGGDPDMAADDYLVHPFSAAELIACVRSHLALSHARRAWAIEREHAAQEMARTRCADRVNALDVPALSRIASHELQREPIDVTAVARGIVAELRRGDPGRVVDVEVTDGLTAIGDPQLVAIALGHLLGNAWKFTGKRARAEIRVERERDGIFVVRDNGAGFDMAQAGRLFVPFERLHPSDDFDGAGIGLAVVRRIAERHGGDAWAYGAVEEGATIWFSLGPGSDPDRP
jgi:CheY-like chemotaxis protein